MFGLERRRSNVEWQAHEKWEVGDRWHKMPKGVIRTQLILRFNHVNRWRIVAVDKLSGQVHEHRSLRPAHLLQPEHINGYPGDVQHFSMSHAFRVIHVDLDSAFNGAATHEYARRKIQTDMYSRVAVGRKF